MQTIRNGCLLSAAIATAATLWLVADLLRDFFAVVLPATSAFTVQALPIALLCLRVVGGMVCLAVGCLLFWWLRRSARQGRYQRDGAWAVEYYHLYPFPRRAWRWLRGLPSPRVRLDPNLYVGHALIIADAVYEVAPAAGWDAQLAYAQDVERTRRIQALAPGDEAISLPWVGGNGGRAGVANSATGKLLAGGYDKAAKLPAADARQATPQLSAPAPAPVELPIDYGIQRAATQDWPLGYDAKGGLAIFNPAYHGHVAIVGATGTGKTTSAGYLLAAYALRQGWHVVVLDADDGASWSPFAMQAEVAATDAEVFGAQIASLHREFERRQRLIAEAGASDISQLEERRVLLIIEEYGDLSHTLRLRDRSQAAAVDAQLDTLLRRGRKAGVHVALLDQYPEHWSNQLLANCKFRIVFQLGPNQGAKLEEYKASELPGRGAFLLNHRQYTAWHAAPHVRELLAAVPALSVSANLIGAAPAPAFGAFGRSAEEGEGGPTSGSERPNATPNALPNALPNATPNAEPAGPTDLQEAVWAWRDANPTGGQADMRRQFAARGIDIARGYAHECWHRWPGPAGAIDLSTDAGRAAFAALAKDARLPGGARLGVDITTKGGGEA